MGWVVRRLRLAAAALRRRPPAGGDVFARHARAAHARDEVDRWVGRFGGQ